MNFSLIVATDSKNGIGFWEYDEGSGNDLFKIPWKKPNDLKFFKDLTSSKNLRNSVIMGKNTYLSLPVSKLIDRTNIVITSHPELISDPDVKTFNSFNSALEYCKKENFDENYVIGGSILYKEALEHPNLEYIYWNIIKNTTCSCNISFPISFQDAIQKYKIDTTYELSNTTSNDVNFNRFICRKENICENKYLDLLKEILEKGDERKTRNAVTKSIFGERLVFNLDNQIPILTTKKMFVRGIFEELIWFLKGETDSKILESKNVNIWKWNSTKEFIESVGLPYDEGDIGNMYGFQLNHSGEEYKGCHYDYYNKGFNQINYCLNLLKNDKFSRRIIMTTFSPHEANKGVLYPCHGIVIQFYVREYDGLNYLSCHMYQRSADMFLGVPFNIVSYSLLVYMICNVLNDDEDIEMKFKPDKLIMSFGDLHIYDNHYEQVKKQITRSPFLFPKIEFKEKRQKLTEFDWTDIRIINYNYHDQIKADMVA